MTRSTSTPWIAPLVLGALLFTPRSAAADEPDPFEALIDGRVESGAASGAEALRVSVPGRGSSPLRPDGTYRLEGIPVGLPVRVFGIPDSAEMGPGAGRPIISSEVRILDAATGFDSQADLLSPGKAPPPVFALELAGPDGSSTVTLSDVGRTARLVARGVTASGAPYGRIHGPLESPAVRIESSDSSVASVSSSGEVTAVGPGLAWVRVFGDGEWAQVLVRVDTSLDSDGDGMPDSHELAHGFDPFNPADGASDRDSDGLTAREEFERGTDPLDADTDGDLVFDGLEITRGTDPLESDTDGDIFVDGSEVSQGTDPLNPNEKPGSDFTPGFKASRTLSAAGVRVAVSADGYAFVIAADGRITSYRIDPVSSFIIFRDVETLSPDLRDIAVEGTTVYVAAASAGLHIVDASNPAVLVRTSTLSGIGQVVAVAARKGTVFLATESQFRIYRQGAGGALELAGSLPVPAFNRFAVSGSYAFLGIPGINRIISVDISDPAAPRELGRFLMPPSTTPFRAMAASAGTVYVAHGNAGLIAVSAADPRSLEVIDTAALELPGAPFDAVSLLGNRLAAHTGASNARVQLFRVLEDGSISLLRDVLSNSSGAFQLVSSQEYVLSFNAASFAVSQVLPRGDRAGVPPVGQLRRAGNGAAAPPGARLLFTASARDDIYIEAVDFLVDGRIRFHDSVPPFRFHLEVDAALPAPYDLAVSAIAVDLQGSETFLGATLVEVRADLDMDGIADPADADSDGDGVPDLEEIYPGIDGFISDPSLLDSDGDGIPDGEELYPGAGGHVTNPGSADTDGDGLTDPYEIATTLTDPTSADSDGDGTLDGDEDLDSDGLANREEERHGSDPRSPDSDFDGLLDGLEGALGLDPTRPDTDGDGTADGGEDSDQDGLSNANEVARGTDPGAADTDTDGFDDPTEIALGTDPAARTDFSSRAVVFNSGTVTVRGPLTLGSLALRGAVLTVPAPSGAHHTPLEITVAGALTIDTASRIDVSGKGLPGGRGPGNESHTGLGPGGGLPPDALTGGSHGGHGGRGGATSGARVQATHGSFAAPRSAGGGGSAAASGTARGGNGGGVIALRAGTVVLDGVIAAMGEGAPAAPGAGGGAGGSIFLEASELRGSGSIDASGGSTGGGGGGLFGAGGGGRVAVIAASASGFDAARITARGGGVISGPPAPEAAGGAGTVLFVAAGEEGGTLTVENGGRKTDGSPTPIESGVEEVIPLARLVVRAAGAASTPAALHLLRSQGALELSSGGHLEAGEVRLEAARDLELVDATLEVGRILVETGPLDRLSLTRSMASIGSEVDAASCVLRSSTLVVAGPLTASSLELFTSTLTVPDPTVERRHGLEVTVSGTLQVDGGSRIDLARKGFVGGYEGGSSVPAGQAGDDFFAGGPGAGGGHAGAGGLSDSAAEEAGAVQGGFEDTGTPGGGGSTEAQLGPFFIRGGNGGGAASIQSGTLILDGVIDASGADAENDGAPAFPRAGAGAGGSVRITTDVLRGSGSVIAAGGFAHGAGESHGGGGGGGRIVLIHGDRSAFSGVLRAPGGGALPSPGPERAVGGAGTVFTRSASSETGDLIVEAEGLVPRGYLTLLPDSGKGPISLSRLAIRGGAKLESERPLVVASLDADGPGRFTLRGGLRGPLLELPETPLLDLEAAELDVEDLASRGGGIEAVDLRSSRLVLGAPLTVAAIRLAAGSTITVRDPTSDLVRALDLHVEGSLIIEADSAIDLAGKGYVGGGRGGNASRLGRTADNTIPASGGGRVGGSHGALGGFQSAGAGLGLLAQPTYGDFQHPRRPGGGGSARLNTAEEGYDGGGLARLQARTLILDGKMTVEGDGRQREGSSRPGGAGAGGGLLLEVETLSGGGEISADGGSADGGVGAGAGGGGRIAIHYQNRSGFLGSVHAFGGTLVPFVAKPTSAGGAGTIFWKGASQGFGDLIIDNGNRAHTGARTQLRQVGMGTIEALTATTLAPAGGVVFPVSDTRLEGQWVVVNGAVLTPLRILANTSSLLTTDPATGSMTDLGSPGNGFQGAIVLDNLTVTGAAAMTTQGDLIIIATGSVNLSPESTLTAPPVVHW